MRADAPVLVFDSGVGGLSVLESIRALLPQAPVVYAADNAGFPYGTKTEAQIAARVPALLGRLIERTGARLAVIACNTASTIALGPVRDALDLPVVGTVPAIKPAAQMSRTRTIAVLGTDATVRQPYVDRLSAEWAADCTVIRHGSAALVELAEAKLAGTTPDPLAVRDAIAPMFAGSDGANIDTVVLACTHFPLLEPELAAAVPHPVVFVHGAEGIARRVAFLTQGQPWPEAPPPGRALFTGPVPDALRSALARYGLTQVSAL